MWLKKFFQDRLPPKQKTLDRTLGPFQKPIRYGTFHFQQRSGAVLFRNRNCFESSIPSVNRSHIRYTFCDAPFHYPVQREHSLSWTFDFLLPVNFDEPVTFFDLHQKEVVFWLDQSLLLPSSTSFHTLPFQPLGDPEPGYVCSWRNMKNQAFPNSSEVPNSPTRNMGSPTLHLLIADHVLELSVKSYNYTMRFIGYDSIQIR